MTHIRHTEPIPGGQASYPEFLSEPGEEAAARRMNEFYLTLRDAARSVGETIGGSRRYTADYRLETEEDGTVRIEYTLRLRHRGKTEATKTILHRWQNGFLCPPKKQKKRPALFARFGGRRRK